MKGLHLWLFGLLCYLYEKFQKVLWSEAGETLKKLLKEWLNENLINVSMFLAID